MMQTGNEGGGGHATEVELNPGCCGNVEHVILPDLTTLF